MSSQGARFLVLLATLLAKVHFSPVACSTVVVMGVMGVEDLGQG